MLMGVSDLRIGDGPADHKGKDARSVPVDAPPLPPKDPTPAPPAPAPVKKSGLGRQFGRLGGAVAGKNRRT